MEDRKGKFGKFKRTKSRDGKDDTNLSQGSTEPEDTIDTFPSNSQLDKSTKHIRSRSSSADSLCNQSSGSEAENRPQFRSRGVSDPTRKELVISRLRSFKKRKSKLEESRSYVVAEESDAGDQLEEWWIQRWQGWSTAFTEDQCVILQQIYEAMQIADRAVRLEKEKLFCNDEELAENIPEAVALYHEAVDLLDECSDKVPRVMRARMRAQSQCYRKHIATLEKNMLQDMLCSHNNEGMLLHQNPIFRPHKEEGRDAHPPLLPSQSVRMSLAEAVSKTKDEREAEFFSVTRTGKEDDFFTEARKQRDEKIEAERKATEEALARMNRKQKEKYLQEIREKKLHEAKKSQMLHTQMAHFSAAKPSLMGKGASKRAKKQAKQSPKANHGMHMSEEFTGSPMLSLTRRILQSIETEEDDQERMRALSAPAISLSSSLSNQHGENDSSILNEVKRQTEGDAVNMSNEMQEKEFSGEIEPPDQENKVRETRNTEYSENEQVEATMCSQTQENAQKSKKSKKSVSFAPDMEFFEFNRAIGLGVPTDGGPPLGLGEDLINDYFCDFEQYQQQLDEDEERFTPEEYATLGKLIPEERYELLMQGRHRRVSVDLSAFQMRQLQQLRMKTARSRSGKKILQGEDPDLVEQWEKQELALNRVRQMVRKWKISRRAKMNMTGSNPMASQPQANMAASNPMASRPQVNMTGSNPMASRPQVNMTESNPMAQTSSSTGGNPLFRH